MTDQRRRWHPTPVLLPGKSHGWRSLVGYSPWGREESDTTEWLHFHFSLLCIGEGNGNPLQYSCLENPRDRGAWWAAVYRVAQGWMWLKRLSSISSRWQTSSLGELKQLLITYKALQTRNGNRGHMDLRLSLISSIRQNLKPREKNDKVAVQATGNAPSAKLFKE